MSNISKINIHIPVTLDCVVSVFFMYIVVSVSTSCRWLCRCLLHVDGCVCVYFM